MSLEAKILIELSGKQHVSGQAISQKFGISRTAVWKHIVNLRNRGYVIEAAPGNGYLLQQRPDSLLPQEIQPLLRSKTVGRQIVHLSETESTADDARKLIDQKAPEGTVVIAEHQTAGRGRMGRVWKTPAGKAIALSVILYPHISPTSIPLLSLGTALAVKKAVERVVKKETGEEAGLQLKWPNDIYLSGKKLAGILVEMAAEMDSVAWVIDSIGLNVNNSFMGDKLQPQATSLADEFGRQFNRRLLTAALLDELDKIYLSSQNPKGLAAISRQFEQHDMLQKKKVRVSAPHGVISGIASGIDTEGRLLVRGGGKLMPVFNGEASLSGAMPKKGGSSS